MLFVHFYKHLQGKEKEIMGLKTGDKIYYKLAMRNEKYSATIISVNDNSIVLRTDVPSEVAKYELIEIAGADNAQYSIVGIESANLQLKKITEHRDYFRVNDVMPIVAKKTDKCTIRKSKIFAGYDVEMPDMDVSDETLNPKLWKLLVSINTKLRLVLEKLHLESEGLSRAEEQLVNISASGIRFTFNERVEIGDMIEVKMLLPTYPSVGIITYGNVVRVEDIGDGKYEVALNFTEMDDDIRDEIIQYTLKRQRQIFGKSRQDKER